MIDAATRASVVVRAGNLCEYCHWPQSAHELRFHIEHVVARQHGGTDDDVNLALACPHCNRKKGTNLSAFDPTTGQQTAVFHPRQQIWTDHFRWNGPLLIGFTPVGRATVALLNVNHKRRIELRVTLIAAGLFET